MQYYHWYNSRTIRMKITITALFIILVTGLFGQDKYLQLEKVRTLKFIKYFPGDEITFQLSNGLWYTRVIEEVSYETKTIIFSDNQVQIDSIMAIRSYKPQSWSRPIGNQLYNFAIAWTLFSLIAGAVDEDDNYTIHDAGVAATSAGLGFALQKIFKKRTYRLKRNAKGELTKWRIRAMDLRLRTD